MAVMRPRHTFYRDTRIELEVSGSLEAGRALYARSAEGKVAAIAALTARALALPDAPEFRIVCDDGACSIVLTTEGLRVREVERPSPDELWAEAIAHKAERVRERAAESEKHE